MKEISEYLKKIGAKGGKVTAKKHGTEHYRKAALKRWKKLSTVGGGLHESQPGV